MKSWVDLPDTIRSPSFHLANDEIVAFRSDQLLPLGWRAAQKKKPVIMVSMESCTKPTTVTAVATRQMSVKPKVVDDYNRSMNGCGNLDTGTVFVIMSIAHAQSIFMPINVRALCTVIILSCHMLDPAVSSLVNGLVYVKWRRVRDLSETRNGKSWPSPRVQR